MNYITYIYWRICRFNGLEAFDTNKNHHVVGQLVLYLTGAYLSLALFVSALIRLFAKYSFHMLCFLFSIVVFIIGYIAIPYLLNKNRAYVVNRFIELDTLPQELDKKYGRYYTVFKWSTVVVFFLSCALASIAV